MVLAQARPSVDNFVSTSDQGEHWWPSLADPGKRDAMRGAAGILVFGEPHPGLRGHVLSYTGIRGASRTVSAAQRVPPECAVMLTISLCGVSRGTVTTGSGNSATGARLLPAASVTGLHDGCYLIERSGAFGPTMLVALSPPGAYALFGVSLDALANTHVALADLMGRQGVELTERLAAAHTWSARFAALDEMLLRWSRRGRAPDCTLALAWRLIAQTQGGLRIGRLAEEIGCSRRYLEKKFGEQIGLSPKTVARVWRLQRAIHLLTRSTDQPMAEVAHACGYSDQAHLNRDFRVLAGCTPTGLLAIRPQLARATALAR